MNKYKKSQMPLYAQLMKKIREQIQDGTFKAGDQIPTESELADMYQVSRITVRRTIEELCAQGFFDKETGKGNFCEGTKTFERWKRTII